MSAFDTFRLAPGKDDAARLENFAARICEPGLRSFLRLAERLQPRAKAGLVHDLRVGARRLIARLEILEIFNSGAVSRHWRARLAGLVEALSPVRNADASRNILQKIPKKGLSAGEREALAHLRRALKKRRRKKLALALDYWRGEKPSACGEELRFMARSLSRSVVKRREDYPAAFCAHMALCAGQALRRLKKARKEPTSRRLHELRIAVRRLRYAGEIFQAALGRPGAEAALEMRRLQRALGEHHDLAVLIARILKLKRRLRREDPGGAGLRDSFDRLIARCRRAQLIKLVFLKRLAGAGNGE
ncbi:MAG: CHAD domain-containing protein, partial [Elusimicrobia bacterium]|nr:CHAD domain-containing protein [Elusimicrobiota bacterium]